MRAIHGRIKTDISEQLAKKFPNHDVGDVTWSTSEGDGLPVSGRLEGPEDELAR